MSAAATPIAIITGVGDAALARARLEYASYADNYTRVCQIHGRDPRRDFGSGPVEAYHMVCHLEPGHDGDHLDAFDVLTWTLPPVARADLSSAP